MCFVLNGRQIVSFSNMWLFLFPFSIKYIFFQHVVVAVCRPIKEITSKGKKRENNSTQCSKSNKDCCRLLWNFNKNCFYSQQIFRIVLISTVKNCVIFIAAFFFSTEFTFGKWREKRAIVSRRKHWLIRPPI